MRRRQARKILDMLDRRPVRYRHQTLVRMMLRLLRIRDAPC
jgi:hypothetical protein